MNSRQAKWLQRQCEKRYHCTPTYLAIHDGGAFERLCREYRERKPFIDRVMDIIFGPQVA